MGRRLAKFRHIFRCIPGDECRHGAGVGWKNRTETQKLGPGTLDVVERGRKENINRQERV